MVKTHKEKEFNEYYLQEGDFIKLGRVRFRIRDILIDKAHQPPHQIQ